MALKRWSKIHLHSVLHVRKSGAEASGKKWKEGRASVDRSRRENETGREKTTEGGEGRMMMWGCRKTRETEWGDQRGEKTRTSKRGLERVGQGWSKQGRTTASEWGLHERARATVSEQGLQRVSKGYSERARATARERGLQQASKSYSKQVRATVSEWGLQRESEGYSEQAREG